MKTIDQLAGVSSLDNNALLVANNADNTATNNIKFSDLKTQILNGVDYSDTVSAVSFDNGTLSVTKDETTTTYNIPDTDTHYASKTVVAASNSATSDDTAENGHVSLNHVENNAVTASHSITGSGATTVTSDSSGNITITSTNTTYTAATADPTAVRSSAVVGVSANYAREDHAHAISVTTGDADGQVKIAGQNASVKGLGAAAYKGVASSYDSAGTDLVDGTIVAAALATLPEPMVFKGTLGTDGTITTLPAASASGSSKNIGFTYKVITAGTYQGVAAEVGDTLISTGTAWVRIPSGDEPSGTVTSVNVTTGENSGISVSGGPITSSGSITISHADTSDQASSSNSGRTYIQSITLDGMGHVTGLSTATETVTDTTYESKTAASAGTDVSLVTTGEKYTWNNKSDLTLGDTASTAAAGNHTHTVSIAADDGTSALTLANSTKYKLTAGGSTFIFTTPAGGTTDLAQMDGTLDFGNEDA